MVKRSNSNPVEAARSLAVTDSTGMDRESAVFRFLRKSLNDEVGKFKSTHRKNSTFIVDQGIITEIDLRASELLRDYEGVEFSGTVKYNEGYSGKFNDLKSLMAHRGTTKTPSLISLSWSTFSIQTNGHPKAASINVMLSTDFYSTQVTRDRFAEIIFRIIRGHESPVEVSTEGTNEDWVRSSLISINQIVERVFISKLFSWLSFFRFSVFSILLSIVLSAYIAYYVLGDYLIALNQDRELDAIKSVKEAGSVDNKINILSEIIIRGTEPPPDQVFAIVALIVVSIVASAFMATLIDKVAPRSQILIGDGSHLVQREMLALKFVVATVLLPLFIGLLFYGISK